MLPRAYAWLILAANFYRPSLSLSAMKARRLCVSFLTGRFSKFIPGICVSSEAGIAERLGWTLRNLRLALTGCRIPRPEALTDELWLYRPKIDGGPVGDKQVFGSAAADFWILDGAGFRGPLGRKHGRRNRRKEDQEKLRFGVVRTTTKVLLIF